MDSVYIETAGIVDPETGKVVRLEIRKDETGKLFGVESSWLHDSNEVFNPYTKKAVELDPSIIETKSFKAPVISVIAMECFDSTGNSSFSARITVGGILVASLPYQYGYDSHYIEVANKKLMELGILEKSKNPLHIGAEKAGFVFNNEKQSNCSASTVLDWGLI